MKVECKEFINIEDCKDCTLWDEDGYCTEYEVFADEEATAMCKEKNKK